MSHELISLLTGRRGHFRMESGYHSDQWYDLDRLLSDRDRLRPFVTTLAQRLVAHRVNAICGPEIGGAQLAAMVAADLGCAAFRTERFVPPAATGLFPVRYTVPADQRERLRGRRVAIVDDAISAGSAVRGTLADLRACGAQVIAIGALFVFGDSADRLAVEEQVALEDLARPPFAIWAPTECALCLQKIPLEAFP